MIVFGKEVRVLTEAENEQTLDKARLAGLSDVGRGADMAGALN
jgi:hypothetical protein